MCGSESAGLGARFPGSGIPAARDPGRLTDRVRLRAGASVRSEASLVLFQDKTVESGHVDPRFINFFHRISVSKTAQCVYVVNRISKLRAISPRACENLGQNSRGNSVEAAEVASHFGS